MGLGFPDLTRCLEIAKRVAAGLTMAFVRDVGDAYVYAAIGGNLTVGPGYAPDLFVCIHDGMRPDKKTLGFKFEPGATGWRPKDVVDAMSSVSAGSSATDMVRTAATALFDEYAGRNTYQYIVDKVKDGSLPAGSAAAVVASPPAPATDAPPAAAAESAEGAASLVADLSALIDAGRAQTSTATDLGGGRLQTYPVTPFLPEPNAGGGASAPVKRSLGSWFKGKLKRAPKARPEIAEPQDAAKKKQKTATSKNKLFSGGSESLIVDAMGNYKGRIIKDAIRTLNSPEYSDVKMQDLLQTPWQQNPNAPIERGQFASAVYDGPVGLLTRVPDPYARARGFGDETTTAIRPVSAQDFIKLQTDYTPLLDYIVTTSQLAVGSDDAYTRDVGLILSQYPALFTIVSRVTGHSLPNYDQTMKRYTGISEKMFPVFEAAAEQLGLTLPEPRSSVTTSATFGSAVMEPQSRTKRK